MQTLKELDHAKHLDHYRYEKAFLDCQVVYKQLHKLILKNKNPLIYFVENKDEIQPKIFLFINNNFFVLLVKLQALFHNCLKLVQFVQY